MQFGISTSSQLYLVDLVVVVEVVVVVSFQTGTNSSLDPAPTYLMVMMVSFCFLA